jgi:hypothetical protein
MLAKPVGKPAVTPRAAAHAAKAPAVHTMRNPRRTASPEASEIPFD